MILPFFYPILKTLFHFPHTKSPHLSPERNTQQTMFQAENMNPILELEPISLDTTSCWSLVKIRRKQYFTHHLIGQILIPIHRYPKS